jgi:lysophospholipase L1-like esterase
VKAIARALAATIVGVLVASACSGGSNGTGSPPASNAGTAQTLLVVGTGNALGDTLDDPLRDDWPRVVYLESFPRATVFVNAAERNATVASALNRQVPIARELRPDTVLVWVGVNDMDRGVSATTFESGMTDLLRALTTTPDARVLVADIPARAGDDPTVRAAYNAAIATAVRTTGAELVPLSRRAFPAMEVGDDDLDLAGHRQVADAFSEQLSVR